MLQIHWHSKTWFKLRFSGFDDEWKTYKLKDLLHNKSSSISINQLDDNVGNYPLYGASGFLKCIDFYEMDSDYISIVKDGSGVGNISFHEKNTSVVNTSQYILPKENLNIHFIFYLLQTINLNKYKTGSTIPHIYFKDYSIEKVKIPKYDEQKKIGILLKNLDAKIEILDNKLQMCQNFKKYLMQQIFTQKLRFDFKEEWNQYKLKELLTVKSSGISINQMEENSGEYPLYGASGFIKNIDFCEMESDYISIVKDGSGVGNLSYHEKNSSIVNTSQYLLPKKNFDIHFLYYQLQTLNLLKYVNGSSIPHIYFKDYCIEKVAVPSLPEQQKIGKLFVDTDKTLENIKNSIHSTQEFKKGLLQQMFVVRINWRCNFKLAKSSSFNKHLLILKNKIIFIIIK